MPVKKTHCSVCGKEFDYYTEKPPTVDIVKENGETQTIKVCLKHLNLLGPTKKTDGMKEENN